LTLPLNGSIGIEPAFVAFWANGDRSKRHSTATREIFAIARLCGNVKKKAGAAFLGGIGRFISKTVTKLTGVAAKSQHSFGDERVSDAPMDVARPAAW